MTNVQVDVITEAVEIAVDVMIENQELQESRENLVNLVNRKKKIKFFLNRY
jgi:hypothetical protein